MKLFEITGDDVMKFADSLHSSEWIAKNNIPAFEKLGIELLKKDFLLSTNINLRFALNEADNVRGWVVIFPYRHYQSNGVTIMYSYYDDAGKSIVSGREFFTLSQIESKGLDACLAQVKSNAIRLT